MMSFDFDVFWSPSFDNMDEFVFLIDREFVIRRANKAFLIFSSKAHDQVAGQHCYSMMHNTPCPVTNCPHNRLMNSGKFESQELYEPCLDKWFYVRTTPIFSENNEVMGSIHMANDITERIKMQEAIVHSKHELERSNERLRELDKLKSEFVSHVSHELRTPLTPIKEIMSQLTEGILGPVNEQQMKFVNIALRNVDRMSRIVNDLLDMSRIESGAMPMKKEKADIAFIAQGVASSFLASGRAKGIGISCEAKAGLLAYVDIDRITQVFTNIVSNALKFTKTGTITIFVARKDSVIECKVYDTGCGIAPENIGKLFSMFQRFGDTSAAPGTGIGLAISKKLVQMHGGSIYAQSKLGEGTQIVFTLPVFDESSIFEEDVRSAISMAAAENDDVLFFGVRVVPQGELAKLNDFDITVFLREIRDDLNKNRLFKGTALAGGQELILVGSTQHNNADDLKNAFNMALRSHSSGFEVKVASKFFFSTLICDCKKEDYSDCLMKLSAAYVDDDERVYNSRILVVDDDPDILDSFIPLLKSQGFSFIQGVKSGEECLDFVRNNPVDVIFLDVNMPGMNGYEVAGRLKEDIATSKIMIIIISGQKIDISNIAQNNRYGSIFTAPKPLSVDYAVKMLKYIL